MGMLFVFKKSIRSCIIPPVMSSTFLFGSDAIHVFGILLRRMSSCPMTNPRYAFLINNTTSKVPVSETELSIDGPTVDSQS